MFNKKHKHAIECNTRIDFLPHLFFLKHITNEEDEDSWSQILIISGTKTGFKEFYNLMGGYIDAICLMPTILR